MRWRNWLKSVSGTRKKESPERRKQLVFGLDFGTAFTKVAIGEQLVSYALPFGPLAHEGNPYLLPSSVCVQRGGYCTLRRSIGRNVDDLKMRILDKECSREDEATIVAFLALVFQHARDWLFREHGNVYGRAQIDWVINAGLPTDSYDDRDLVNLYTRLVKAGWDLSLGDRQVTLERAARLLDEEVSSSEIALPDRIGPDQLFTFPEFVAQLAGYVRSPRRRDGLHCLVDVGAGTLDATVFNVWKNNDGDDRYPIFARCVEHLGTRYFIRHREKEAGASFLMSPFANLPGDDEFAEKLGVDIHQLRDIDRSFDRDIRDAVMKLVRDTRATYMSKRTQWEFVPLFLCGGGAKAEFYRTLVSDMCRKSQGFNLRLQTLPKPERLDAPLIPDEDTDRLCVAYGLSFEPLDLGEIVRQNNVPHVPPDQKDLGPFGYKPGYIGPEHV